MRPLMAVGFAGTLAVAALALSSPITAATDFPAPPIRHVWVINLENTSYGQAFGDGGNFFGAGVGPHPYLKNVLPSRGALLRQYYAIGHNSLDNYIAELSGQSPTPDTQGDCLSGSDFVSVGTDPHGQAISAGPKGCVYPAGVKTLADQLAARGMTWKGYMEGLGDTGNPPGAPGDGQACGRGNGDQRTDLYAAKHNPYVWFHSLIDQPSCEKRVLPLTALGQDLESITTTPNLSFISPDLCDDAHDCDLNVVDRWLRRYVSLILASPAYRQDGMVVVTFDEASSVVGISGGEDTAACCNEIPGPNTPMPGESGPGGGRVGAVILSPYVKPGTTSDHPYNHYSLLRSLEDAFGITTGGDDGHGHLGYAGSYDATYPGPGSFGCDVYSFYGPCQNPAQAPGPTPTSASSGQPSGPRPSDGSATWRNPLPTANDLTSISCPSASECFAAGEAGTILATTDSGATWSSQASGTAAHLTGISCPTTSACVAVGDGGRILQSTDAGATWRQEQSGTGNDLNAVSCPNASTCYAAGDGGTILTSGDGAQSWTAQPSGTNSALLGISCPDAGTCFVVGDVYVPHQQTTGTVYTAGYLKTSDGATWTLGDTNANGYRLHSVSCPSASTCFVGGDGDGLVMTGDGGGSWRGAFGSRNPQRILGFSCASTSTCVAVGAQLSAFSTTSPAGAIASTTDGRSFSTQSSGTSDQLRGVSCPSPAACYAVGDRGTVLARADGAHWGTQTRTATPIPTSLGSPRQPPTRMPQLLGATCPTTSACFAVGDGGLLVGSGDGGAHWSAQASSTDQRLYAVACAKTTCIAAGDGGTIVATANGTTWSPESSGTPETLAGASCPAARSCYAAGDQGTILATSGRGGAWQAQRSNTTANLNAIDCASAKSCVAVGSLGTILETTNGGSTWTSRSSGTRAYLGGVACPTTTSCYAVGEDGTVLATSDGGKTWSVKSSGIGDELDSISCSSRTSCAASGSSGTVVSTADGGTSWTVQGTGTARDLRSIDCPARTSCVAAGDTGTILQITPRAGA